MIFFHDPEKPSPCAADAAAGIREHLNRLSLADAETGRRLRICLDHRVDPSAVADVLGPAVDALIMALSVETTYGHALADGVGWMLAHRAEKQISGYIDRVTATQTEKGPTLGRLFADHLAIILAADDATLSEHADAAIGIMLKKGAYTLKAPLETLSALIRAGDTDSAHAFLDLLITTFGLDLTYNRTVYLTHTLPRAVSGFDRSRRPLQIRGLTRMITIHEQLADPYLEGLARGLHLLSASALDIFLDQAVALYKKNPKSGIRFLSLDARNARDVCRDLQVAVPLSAVRAELSRYLSARTGQMIRVAPVSPVPGHAADTDARVWCECDGRTLYLPDELDLLEARAANAEMYKLLARLEAGTLEFGSFELDAQRAFALAGKALFPEPESAAPCSELERLIRQFDHPEMALDLFTLFEHSRIAQNVRIHYPGLFSRLTAAQQNTSVSGPTGGALYPFYQYMVFNQPLPETPYPSEFYDLVEDFRAAINSPDQNTPHTSGRFVVEGYPYLAAGSEKAYTVLQTPFGRRFSPERFGAFHAAYQRLATTLNRRLQDHGIQVFQSDLYQLLERQDGRINDADLHRLILSPVSGVQAKQSTEDLLPDLSALLKACGIDLLPHPDTDDAHAFRYPEWDENLGDYLSDRTRLLEREVCGVDTGFYEKTLTTFSGLVRRIRYAFDLLRPEEITILRQWQEGDEFDYRALLDYVIDKKAGQIPSDRLYIKRIKRIRDVATLLLVDLSKSTNHIVEGAADVRVLDVEKQAIVLLCEALTVVGDRFAIAGFSGNGPLGVDYYRIKDMDAAFDDPVKRRINAMAPQRNTRMGAAIRHATAIFKSVAARVRLLLILGDGFPNDLEYKGMYAVEDTRRAIMEARTAGVHVKAITVNVSDNGQLDRLYGSLHHTLIADIRDLPDKLVQVYRALTRH